MAKRGNGEGCIRQRKDKTWEGIYTCGRDSQGKLIRRSVYGKTRKEVQSKLQDITHDIKENSYVDPSNITCNDWFDDWLNRYLINTKDSTKAQYELYLRLYVRPSIGTVKLQKVSFFMIKNIILDCVAEELSPKTIRNLNGIIHHAFADAYKVHLIKDNPADGQDLPKVVKKKMLFLEGDKRKAFCEEIKGKLYEYLFFVALFTGMRQGELLGLSWDAVDFNRNTITVSQQLKRDRRIGAKVDYVIDTTKTDNIRTICPAPIVFDILKKIRREQIENRMKHGQAYENADNLVFTNETGHHLVSAYVLKVFKSRASAIGLPEMRFHDLRHSHVVMRAENGDDMKSVSEDLGHTDIRTTANIYAHVSQRMKEESAKRMQALAESMYVI